MTEEEEWEAFIEDVVRQLEFLRDNGGALWVVPGDYFSIAMLSLDDVPTVH